ncbi:MAG: class I SAM-dependent methyltransferase [Chloroflexota bacterium]
MTLGLVDRTGTILDVGCGDGRLLRWGTKRGLNMIGVEPSKRMRERAGHDTRVLSGCAQALPVAADSIQAIVITYPGGWIRDPATWSEVDRVLVDGGDIAVLLGGTYERGFLSGIRKRAIHLVYGNGTRYELIGDTLPESPQLIIRWLDDRWGSFAVIQSTERDGQ